MSKKLDDLTPLSWRSLTREDLPEFSELLTAIEYLDGSHTRHSLDEVFERFNRNTAGDELVAGFFGNSLLAYAWNNVDENSSDPRIVRISGGVHPAWRSRGIGTQLVRWQVERARKWYRRGFREGHGSLQLSALVHERRQPVRDLYERAGLVPKRWYVDMHRPFEDAIAAPQPIPGVELMAFDPQFSARVRAAHNLVFTGIWGVQPVSEVSWQESLSGSAARPEWSWLALDTDHNVIGYAMNSAHTSDWEAQGFTEGWTDRLGVCPQHRGRGIAKALLRASMRSFQRAGLEAAGLGVDSENPFGAVGLYRALGYLSADTVLRYQRTEKLADTLAKEESR